MCKFCVGQTGWNFEKDAKNTIYLSGIITLRQNSHNTYKKMAYIWSNGEHYGGVIFLQKTYPFKYCRKTLYW